MWDRIFYAVAFFAFGIMAGYTMGSLDTKEAQREYIILQLENERLEVEKFTLEYELEKRNVIDM